MDLFNQTLNGFSTHLAVSFNPDIFESNIINISLLLGGIIYLGSNLEKLFLHGSSVTTMHALSNGKILEILQVVLECPS